MNQQTEMPEVGERTELGQRVYDVLEQKQRVAEDQERLGEMQQLLMDQMRTEGKDEIKASGYVFTIQDVAEKLKITRA